MEITKRSDLLTDRLYKYALEFVVAYPKFYYVIAKIVHNAEVEIKSGGDTETIVNKTIVSIMRMVDKGE